MEVLLPRYMQAFHRALEDCGLNDVGFLGDPFTWHQGEMRSKLDRALTYDAWNQLQENATVLHLEYNYSDHIPVLLDT
jgi:hypothetical protein